MIQMQNLTEKLAATAGVLSVVLVCDGSVDVAVSPHSSATKEQWQTVFRAILGLVETLRGIGQKDLRIVLDNVTLTTLQEAGTTLVVASTLGHPIAKSVRRMMRRSLSRRTRTAVAPSPQPSMLSF